MIHKAILISMLAVVAAGCGLVKEHSAPKIATAKRKLTLEDIPKGLQHDAFHYFFVYKKHLTMTAEGYPKAANSMKNSLEVVSIEPNQAIIRETSSGPMLSLDSEVLINKDGIYSRDIGKISTSKKWQLELPSNIKPGYAWTVIDVHKLPDRIAIVTNRYKIVDAPPVKVDGNTYPTFFRINHGTTKSTIFNSTFVLTERYARDIGLIDTKIVQTDSKGHTRRTRSMAQGISLGK